MKLYRFVLNLVAKRPLSSDLYGTVSFLYGGGDRG